MNYKLFIVLFFPLLVACTGSTNSQDNGKSTESRENLDQIEILLKERKEHEVIGKVLQQMYNLQESAAQISIDETQAEYARRLFGLLFDAYSNSRQFTIALACLDSLERIPFWQESCGYEFPVNKAKLCQWTGNNQEAIQWADTYLALPECTDAERFISCSEAISGVYAYCSNDVDKAVRILEKAVEVYRNGGKYPHILRIISRLGIYYHMMGEYDKAIAANQEVIDSYNDSIPPQDVVMAYGEQANLYTELGLYEQALEQNSTALHYSLLKDSFGLGDLYRYRSEIFSLMKKGDSVFHYLSLGGQVSAHIGSFRGVLVNKVEMVKAYLDYPDSLQKALQLGLSICPDTMHMPKWAQYQLEFYLGQVMQRTGQTQRGIALIEKAAAGFASMNMVENEEAANRILMKYFQQMNMNDAFMHYYNRNQVFVDSLRADKKLRAIAAANIRFNTGKKEKENELLSTRIKIQQQQLFHNICISLSLLILLAGSIGYLIYKRKTIRLLVEHSEREVRRLMTSRQELDRRNALLAEQIEQVEIDHNLTTIRRLTGQSLLSKDDENMFRKSFAALHPSYLPNLRADYPNLTRNEELLAMLICMNQSTDEIALIMGINRSSVNVVRSRMRKKMKLSKEDSLDDILKGLCRS